MDTSLNNVFLVLLSHDLVWHFPGMSVSPTQSQKGNFGILPNRSHMISTKSSINTVKPRSPRLCLNLLREALIALKLAHHAHATLNNTIHPRFIIRTADSTWHSKKIKQFCTRRNGRVSCGNCWKETGLSSPSLPPESIGWLTSMIDFMTGWEKSERCMPKGWGRWQLKMI